MEAEEKLEGGKLRTVDLCTVYKILCVKGNFSEPKEVEKETAPGGEQNSRIRTFEHSGLREPVIPRIEEEHHAREEGRMTQGREVETEFIGNCRLKRSRETARVHPADTFSPQSLLPIPAGKMLPYREGNVRTEDIIPPKPEAVVHAEDIFILF
jgi:hypothetical protein